MIKWITAVWHLPHLSHVAGAIPQALKLYQLSVVFPALFAPLALFLIHLLIARYLNKPPFERLKPGLGAQVWNVKHSRN